MGSLSEERKRQLERDIGTIIQLVEDEDRFCSCCEGDIQDSFPAAKGILAKKIIKLLEAWSLV